MNLKFHVNPIGIHYKHIPITQTQSLLDPRNLLILPRDARPKKHNGQGITCRIIF
jgi:hypothetical protein